MLYIKVRTDVDRKLQTNLAKQGLFRIRLCVIHYEIT